MRISDAAVAGRDHTESGAGDETPERRSALEKPPFSGEAGEIYRLHRLFVEGNETWRLEPWIDNVDEDIVAFVGDGSVWRGREQVRREWSLTGELIEGRWRMETIDLAIETFPDAAWAIYEFRLHGMLAGEPFDRRGRGTELYRRRGGRWLMAAAHFSWIQ